MKRSRGQAFSLIELMVALAILMIGVYALADLLISSRRTANMGDDRIVALALGRMKLRELQVARDHVTSLLGKETETIFPSQGPEPFAEMPRLRWHALVRRSGSPNTMQVTISVSSTRGDPVASVDGLILTGPLSSVREGAAQ